MKIMISQPMRGKTEEQIKAEREELVEKLMKEGHEVVNSIFTDKPPINCDKAVWFLGRSIELMSKVDGLVCMQGWEDARGCRIEEQCAREYGKFIRYE